MREIKFRAWLPDSERMISHEQIDLTAGEVFERTYYPDTGFVNAFKRENAKLMQFTGLRDKNGREIYEGDATRCFAFGLTTVEFRKGSFGLYSKYRGFIPFHEIFGHSEVVGNIHENPELLEGEK